MLAGAIGLGLAAGVSQSAALGTVPLSAAL
jgi:hypothetical protein